MAGVVQQVVQVEDAVNLTALLGALGGGWNNAPTTGQPLLVESLDAAMEVVTFEDKNIKLYKNQGGE